MEVCELVQEIEADFYTGVPDSQLRELCDFLMEEYGIDPQHHIIAANEGNCVALGAGYHLATGKIPVVYMQNSGEGNIINPVASLLNDKVYGIPMIFIIGWRGEPGTHDEPQHLYQGQVTLNLLEVMGVNSFVIDKKTTVQDLRQTMEKFRTALRVGRQVAFVIKKGALKYSQMMHYSNSNKLLREEAIQHIVNIAEKDPIISTTGKASRELFETREFNKQGHRYDFLTVGSMGHCSSIALGVALNSNKKVWCIDGDGAVLMHMGAMALIGANSPSNMVHIIINNQAHETVGGMPSVAGQISFVGIAKACGYPYAVCVNTAKDLDEELEKVKKVNQLCMIEVACAMGARNNLGRPTTTATENKYDFMSFLRN